MEQEKNGQERKTHKINEEDFAKLQQIKLIETENLQYQRLRTIEHQAILIRNRQRAIDYKRNQIKEGNCKEKHEAFIDGIKPVFMLESDIEQINFEISGFIDVIQGAAKEYLRHDGEKEEINEILKRYELSIEV